MLRQQAQSNLTFQADNMRRSLTSAVNSTSAWKQTTADPANTLANGPHLDCFPNTKPCTTNESTDLAGGGVPISDQLINKILDASGGTVVDVSQPTYGISPQGKFCTTFKDPVTFPIGDDSCPLRF